MARLLPLVSCDMSWYGWHVGSGTDVLFEGGISSKLRKSPKKQRALLRSVTIAFPLFGTSTMSHMWWACVWETLQPVTFLAAVTSLTAGDFPEDPGSTLPLSNQTTWHLQQCQHADVVSLCCLVADSLCSVPFRPLSAALVDVKAEISRRVSPFCLVLMGSIEALPPVVSLVFSSP